MLLGRIVSSNQKSTPCHGQSELNGIVVSEHKFCVELTQAWSYQMKAVLLAANTRRTQSCSGSGIYLQGEVRCECPKLSILTLAKIKDPIWDRRIYKKHIIIQKRRPKHNHWRRCLDCEKFHGLAGQSTCLWFTAQCRRWWAFGGRGLFFRGGLVGISKVPNWLLGSFWKQCIFCFTWDLKCPNLVKHRTWTEAPRWLGFPMSCRKKRCLAHEEVITMREAGDNDNSPVGDSGSHPTTDKNKPQTRNTDHQQLQYSLCSRDPPSRKNEVARLWVMLFFIRCRCNCLDRLLRHGGLHLVDLWFLMRCRRMECSGRAFSWTWILSQSGGEGDLVFGVGFCGNVHGTKVWICGIPIWLYLICHILKRYIFIYDIWRCIFYWNICRCSGFPRYIWFRQMSCDLDSLISKKTFQKYSRVPIWYRIGR